MRRIVTPVLLLVFALAPLSAALLPAPAAAADTDAPIQVRLTTLTPLVPQHGDTLVLAGTLRNVSAADVANLGYQLELGDQQVGTRSEFDDYADSPDASLTSTNLRAVDDVVDATQPTLAPGQSETFELTVDVNALALPDSWQVRELGISVTGTTPTSLSIAAVGQLRTFLPWAPSTSIGNGYPTRVAWIWPLVDRPHRSATATWFDDALAPELSRTGRLTGLLDAGAAAESQRIPGSTTHDVPVTWAVDPMLVSDAEAMAAGYQVQAANGAAAGTGTAVAKTWLATFQAAVKRSDAAVMPLPFADPDVVAAVRAGFATATTIGLATTSGLSLLQHAIGVTDPLRYGWPPGGLADPRAINALLATGDSTVVLSDNAVPPVNGQPSATPSAHTVITTGDGPVDTILTDPVLSTDVNSGVDDPNGARLSIQRFLAETLMIQREGPNSRRDVVVAPNRRWAPRPAYAAAVLRDTGKVPWIQPVSLEQVKNGPVTTSVARKPLTYPPTARHDELPKTYLDQVSKVRKAIGNFSAILPQGQANAEIRAYTTAEQQALSSAWRQQPALAQDQISALGAAVKTQMDQVQITSKNNSFVTLTSHGGQVPVTIANNLSTPVEVTVQLQAHQRLSFSGDGRVTVPIPAHQQKLVHVHAAAKTSGVFPLQVQLFTPEGKKYGDSVQLFVRSTAYGTITLVITGAATAALMVAVAIRLTRRAFAARRSAANPSP